MPFSSSLGRPAGSPRSQMSHQSSHSRLGSQKQERKEVQPYPQSQTISHLLKIHLNYTALRKMQCAKIQIQVYSKLDRTRIYTPERYSSYSELVCIRIINPSSLNLRSVSSKTFTKIVHFCKKI